MKDNSPRWNYKTLLEDVKKEAQRNREFSKVKPRGKFWETFLFIAAGTFFCTVLAFVVGCILSGFCFGVYLVTNFVINML